MPACLAAGISRSGGGRGEQGEADGVLCMVPGLGVSCASCVCVGGGAGN